jgi:hypothetical protein
MASMGYIEPQQHKLSIWINVLELEYWAGFIRVQNH